MSSKAYTYGTVSELRSETSLDHLEKKCSTLNSPQPRTAEEATSKGSLMTDSLPTALGLVNGGVTIKVEATQSGKEDLGQTYATLHDKRAALIVAAVQKRGRQISVEDVQHFINCQSWGASHLPQHSSVQTGLKRKREDPLENINVMAEYKKERQRAAVLYMEEILQYKRAKQLNIFSESVPPVCRISLTANHGPVSGISCGTQAVTQHLPVYQSSLVKHGAEKQMKNLRNEGSLAAQNVAPIIKVSQGAGQHSKAESSCGFDEPAIDKVRLVIDQAALDALSATHIPHPTKPAGSRQMLQSAQGQPVLGLGPTADGQCREGFL